MLIIDRFEADKAVIEFSKGDDIVIFDIPRLALPVDVGEGDILRIEINKDASQNRKKEMQKLSDGLFE
ncbi:DUF3006 domain-containing protein [Halocella sp. SP3-1]|uniref:DUF3006 domain-containing protein n=1 Tax=Halocella sp. SP3-1 TaxID=2382161 RepID=UPI000F74FF08|nr:DUF3006 domain-containing protein [Halocella sp. SP3-1]AZO96054.1 DUF3006 domain-containing protein [Halocella sp. SP3-1]